MLEAKKDETLLSVREAARSIGVTPGRIRQLIVEGKIKGRRVGPRFWLIPESELKPFKEPSGIGRPRSGAT